MKYTGVLSKMRVEHSKPVSYYLLLGEDGLPMNDLIGQPVKMEYHGIIHCIACGRTIKKAFGQGFCYPCFIKSPLNSECILKPELCLAHEGKGRDHLWEEENHNQPHIVYLALTGGIKVGVTRSDQIPTRWIDQGAWKAVKLAQTPYRYLAGMIEMELKKSMSDKTPWQMMLKNEMNHSIDILKEKGKIIKLNNMLISDYLLPGDNEIYDFEYPVLQYPQKIKSINLDKTPYIEEKLMGIRGQYLILSNEQVINIRKHSGYEITLEV